ncbi:MAG: metal ABC transporter ATP-binding protein [Candidatus Saccharibacteria bacterium]|nr:metal ABC transporter ATP-binding protein [Candidatus Saccharibacteria bacterium]
MKLIELKNLSLGYDGNAVLKNLNISIDEGDFICIVGPNGAGKSTLVKGILGLLKPLNGEVVYHKLKQNFIGYMPQETQVDANFPASVFEIVLSGTLNRLGLKPFYTNKEKQIALFNLKFLGIESLKDKNFCDLSGGQRQKVLLARSLSATSKLLILDEPSNNLDSKSKRELYKKIVTLNQKQGITIIMITHDLDHDSLLGNKILSLREDDLFFGSTKEFIRKVHHE